MNLNGGVIIIGSLIWDKHLDNTKHDNIRLNWRTQNLVNKNISTKVPIRYGRKSKRRNGTYTMVFSKSCEHSLGRGIILQFKENIISFEGLEQQAIALAIAEGIYKEDNNRLTSSWGSVGLLINPNLKKNDFATHEFILYKWASIYHDYKKKFKSINYKSNKDKEAVITQQGLLNINWQPEMDGFGVLIATPVIPEPEFPTPEEIAQKMIDAKYQEYFQSNKKSKIYTFQDDEIESHLQNIKNKTIH